MSVYSALVNTAGPRTGFIRPGEVLSGAQCAALGQDKLDELVRAGVLRVNEDGVSGERDAGSGVPCGREEDGAADEEAALPGGALAEELIGGGEEKPRRGRGRK